LYEITEIGEAFDRLPISQNTKHQLQKNLYYYKVYTLTSNRYIFLTCKSCSFYKNIRLTTLKAPAYYSHCRWW